MRDAEREAKVAEVLKVAEEMDAKAKLVAAHMAARERLTQRQRNAADLEFMMAISDEKPFWGLVLRAFEYMRDTAKVTAEMMQDEAFRPRKPI